MSLARPIESERSQEMPVRRRFMLKRTLGLSLLSFVLAYATAEVVCTAFLPLPPGTTGSDTFWIVEDVDGIRFDPVIGFRVPQTPVRFARVTKGTVEYVGTYRGNAQGFQGAKDFTLKKPPGVKRRHLVIGDCFTSGTFLQTTWAERAELSLRDCELMNASVDGAGLANWWSILVRLIEPQQYEFDSVIFALIPNDLNRPFVVADYRRDISVAVGYAVWSRDSFALDTKRAFNLLTYLTMLKVSPDEFDASLAERRLRRGVERRSLLRPRLATWIAGEVYPRPTPPKELPPYVPACPVPAVRAYGGNEFFNAEQMSLILDIRNRLAKKHTPITVIHIPGRDELLSHRDESVRVRKFAELLGARFIDGSRPFRSLKEAEICANYLPYDGHWNQAGSDRFADFVVDELK